MLTKQTTIDQITVTENGVILIREATRIMEDGVELSQTFHRSSLTPGRDLTGQPENVVAIATAVWTPEVVATYAAQQQSVTVGTLKLNGVIFGDSATDTQNFLLKTNADGSMKLARKSAGAGGNIQVADTAGALL